MAKITDLTDGGAAQAADEFAVNRGGLDRKVTVPVGDITLYDLAFYYPGIPADDAILSRVVIPRACYLPNTATNSRADAEEAATGALTATIRKNGSSIGSIAWSAAGTVGAFTVSGNQTFAAGDILDVVNASTADATLGDISITLALILGAP